MDEKEDKSVVYYTKHLQVLVKLSIARQQHLPLLRNFDKSICNHEKSLLQEANFLIKPGYFLLSVKSSLKCFLMRSFN